ncbi:hypothetical protein [Fusibacter sp. JL216-2]|uniref:hypothetical protein n=1 Tax=Fusibacter sp. JL216-2 TaxID=3071453 RepID=UPI003D3571D3
MRSKTLIFVLLIIMMNSLNSYASVLENLQKKPEEIVSCNNASGTATGNIFKEWIECHFPNKTVHIESNLDTNSVKAQVVEDLENKGDVSIWTNATKMVIGHEYAYIVTVERTQGRNLIVVQSVTQNNKYIRTLSSKPVLIDGKSVQFVKFTPEEGDSFAKLKMSLYGDDGDYTTYSDVMLIDLTNNPLPDEVLVKLNYFDSDDFNGITSLDGLSQDHINQELLREIDDLRNSISYLVDILKSDSNIEFEYDDNGNLRSIKKNED